jgi:flavin-binding protein dodecin
MWIEKHSELIGSSEESFEAAARAVVRRAHATLRGITGIEIVDKQVEVESGKAARYLVRLRLRFDMAPETLWHW